MSERRQHVYEADVVRVLTFACVIAVHTVAHTEPTNSVGANGFEMLLHFTREAFFVLTGFVLLHQSLARSRPMAAGAFWRRRLAAVGVPYVTWSIIYTGIQATAGWRSSSYELNHLLSNLAFGTAWYHLYFLLVSMQIYLLFPLIDRLVRATLGHHALLLISSATAQLVILSYQMYWPPKHGWLASVANHQDALIISYQFYVLLGAVAAMHLDELRALAVKYRRGVIVAVLTGAIGAEAWYLLAVRSGVGAERAAAVLQPVMLVWAVAAVAGLFLLGTRYQRRRVAGSRLDRALATASDRSFGVFLVHPLVLWLLLQGQVRWLPNFPDLPLTVVAYVAVVAGSLAATELFRRTPLSLALTGRRELRPTTTSDLSRETPVVNQAAYRKENDHARDDTHPSRAGLQAPHERDHDGDRHRAADPLLL
jgi:peptidoglycan/LPS O-acetylase OafA/YrhL